MKPKRISIRNLGPVADADIEFGGLTVLVGPQATGKSIFTQLLKLVIDISSIKSEYKRFNYDWDGSESKFIDLYFGEGMASMFDPGLPVIEEDGKPVTIKELLRKTKKKEERAFLIPAQRVLSLKDGVTRTFTDYRAGDPYSIREFSERLHQLVQSEFGKKEDLFPAANRLRSEYRNLLSKHIFGEFGLKSDQQQMQRRLVLTSTERRSTLPYLVWSAGQREFIPLLLGLYWLLPPAAVSLREEIEWVLLEEIEMGLHPNAISAVMVLVLELIKRGYRVCLSTHSPHVLDIVWALRILQESSGTGKDVLDIFTLPQNPAMNDFAKCALEMKTRVYYFKPDGIVQDISALDPGSEDTGESGWGGLTEFSGRIGDIVARVVNRSSVGKSRRRAK